MAGSNHKVSIVVGVQDLASRSLRSIQSALNSFGSSGTLLGAFSRNLGTITGQMDKLANSMYKFNMYTSSIQRNLRNITMIGGGVAAGLAIQGTNRALEYDYKTRVMQSRMEANDSQRKDVSKYILNDLSFKTSYKPTDIADIGVLLGQGGVNNARDMKALLKTTTYFSEAVDAVPQDAAEMIIAAAKGFNVSMENSGQITDKLTVALNKSLLAAEEMPHAIGELAGRANMFGQGLDASLTALMTMRNQGMSAAQGSQDLLNALRSASRIGNDKVLFARTKSYFSNLGITDAIFNKDTRQLKEFPELIGDIEQAMIKQGYINPKYKKGITDEKSFHAFLQKNGGIAPADFWDAEKAMPLITRVFGAAGQAPIMMGLQSKYEELNADGEKTGKVFYGADALRQMYKDVKNSNGAVDNAHDIISKSGKFQLEVLSNVWESAQIKFLDGLVPLIKTGAEQLVKTFNPNAGNDNNKNKPPILDDFTPKTPIDAFRESLRMTVDNYNKNGNTTTANIINTVGNGAINTFQISKTMPALFSQISEAFNKDIAKADWGSNLIEFPWAIVKNGVKFISDIIKANKDFDEAVKQLPKDLQDPAKLVETLVKGGMVLMVSGAVIKVIELGVRGVSAALKGTKIAADLTSTIIKFLTGKGGKGGGVVGEVLGKNMAIKANIVNVYGSVVNGGAGKGPGGAPVAGAPTPTGGSPAVPPAVVAGGSKLVNGLKSAGKWILKDGIPLAVMTDMMLGAYPDQKSYTRDFVQSHYNPLNAHSDEKIDTMYNILKDPSTFTGPRDTELKPGDSGFFNWVKVDGVKTTPANDPTYFVQNDGKDWLSRLNSWVNATFKDKTPAEKAKETQTIMEYMQKNNDTSLLNSPVLSGFNAAVDNLQNMKLNNQFNVVVEPPKVIISGNISDNVSVKSEGSSSFTVREQTKGTAYERMQQISGRRLGWN